MTPFAQLLQEHRQPCLVCLSSPKGGLGPLVPLTTTFLEGMLSFWNWLAPMRADGELPVWLDAATVTARQGGCSLFDPQTVVDRDTWYFVPGGLPAGYNGLPALGVCATSMGFAWEATNRRLGNTRPRLTPVLSIDILGKLQAGLQPLPTLAVAVRPPFVPRYFAARSFAARRR